MQNQRNIFIAKQLIAIAQELTTAKGGPANVKNPEIWDKAEKAIVKQYGLKKPTEDRFYRLVNDLYQKMGGEFTHKSEK